MKLLGIELKLTYKTLVFGYKLIYEAYKQVNILLSHIFFAIYKYWLKNSHLLNIKYWIFCELKNWQKIYNNMKYGPSIISKFIQTWSELT